MTKKIKSIVVSLLIALLSICACVAVFSFSRTNAAFADETVQGVDSVYIRVPMQDENEEFYGIKFRGYVTEAQYEANSSAAANEQVGVTYGIEIIPEDLIGTGTAYDSGADGSSLKLTKNGDVYYFYASLIDVKEGNLTRPYAARTYYKIGENAKQYGEWCAGRAIFSIATQALADDNASLSSEQEEKLNSIVTNVTDTDKDGHYYAKSLTVTENTGKQLDALATGDVITVNATLTNGVNDLPVYPEITAVNVDGLGEQFDGVLTKVAGTQNQYTVNFETEKAFKIKQVIGGASSTSTDNVVDGETALITSASEFEAFSSAENTTKKHAVLVNDIDGVTKVGASGNSQNYGFRLKGVFDGNGKKITNVSVSGYYGGLFDSLGENSTVKDLYAQGSVTGTRSGLLAGSWQEGYAVDIKNVVIDAELTSCTNGGAVVGWGNNVNVLTVDGLIVFAKGAAVNANYAAFVNAVNQLGTLNMTNSYFFSDLDLVTFTSSAGSQYETNKNKINPLKVAITDIGSSTYTLGGTDDLAISLAAVSGDVTKVMINGLTAEYSVVSNELIISAATVNALENNSTNTIAIITSTGAYSYVLQVGLKSQGLVSEANGVYTLDGQTKTGAHGYFIVNVNNSYIGWQGNYGAGYYLEFEFTGNNMPQMMFYADSIDGKLYGYTPASDNKTMTEKSVRQGLLLLNGLDATQGLSSDASNGNNAGFRIWGMNRFQYYNVAVDVSIAGAYKAIKDYLMGHMYTEGDQTGMNAFTEYGLANDYADVTFKYVVGTYENAEGKICVDAKLYNKADGSLVASIDLATAFAAADYSGSIVAYATVKAGEDTTFTVVKGPYVPAA